MDTLWSRIWENWIPLPWNWPRTPSVPLQMLQPTCTGTWSVLSYSGRGIRAPSKTKGQSFHLAVQLHYSLPLIYHLMDRLRYQSNMSLSALCSIPTTTPLLFVTPQENSQMPCLTCYFLSSPPIFTSFNVSLAFIPVFSQLHTDKKLFLLRLLV